MTNNELELYIHIPFCKRKCNYCDFVSFAGCEDQIDNYLDALCNEIISAAKEYRDRTIVSVYIGGGTPSILNCGQISRLINTLLLEFQISGIFEKRKGRFLQKKIRAKTEFTLECNPGTIDKEKIQTYKKLGVNRLSIGLQSTDQNDLNMLGRIHDYQDFAETFELAREEGFDNINVDLMQAIPGQTLAAWKRVLAVLATWKPEHISAYSLIIEDGTPFKEKYDAGLLNLPTEETEREIYYYTRDFLGKAGYQRYEISNYAVPGFECFHNIGYWVRRDYLGLGLNASSMIQNVRWKNTSDLVSYLKSWQNNTAQAFSDRAREEEETLSHSEQMEEFVFLGLRMTEGIDKLKFFEIFHQDFDYTYGETLRKLKNLDLLKVDGNKVYLTDRGFDVSNLVLAEFLTER